MSVQISNQSSEHPLPLPPRQEPRPLLPQLSRHISILTLPQPSPPDLSLSRASNITERGSNATATHQQGPYSPPSLTFITPQSSLPPRFLGRYLGRYHRARNAINPTTVPYLHNSPTAPEIKRGETCMFKLHVPRHVPTGVDISFGDMREREILFTSFLRACLCWTRVRRGFEISLFLSLPLRWHVMMRDLNCPSTSCRSDTERPGQEGVIVTPRFLRLGRPASQVIACFHLPPCRLYILKNSSLGCLGVSSD